VVDSIIRLGDLVKAAAADRMPALALTDLSNLYAAVKFHKACQGKGIKPIFGSEVVVGTEQTRVTLLAMNQTGWRHLIEIVSRGYTDGLNLGVPQVEREWIFAKHEGLIVLLGQHSEVGKLLCSAVPERAQPVVQAWQAVFGDRLYLALTRTQRPGEDDYIEAALDLAEAQGLPVVAHNDLRFMTAEDFDAHEARVCIAGGYTLADERRPRMYSAEQYF
jgi:DNA polymerase-3 subunit alpha